MTRSKTLVMYALLGLMIHQVLTMGVHAQRNQEVNIPFITPATYFLEADPYLLKSVDDGVFWLKRGDFFSGEKYEFWKADGTKLFNAEWEKVSTGEPVFNSGVVPMRKPSEGYKRGNVCLLYSDGKMKDLNVKWQNVTNFVDGVAIVTPEASSCVAFFIDTTGKKIYPTIKVDGCSGSGVHPLSSGLRAYKAYGADWGYIDGAGVSKLAPKYKEAGDFSEGYAWVVMSDNTRHLIDTSGKSVFKAPDGAGKVSPVVDGRFYIEEPDKTCYYDLQGQKLACFQFGNPFFGGYTFVTRPRDFSDLSTLIIDTDMKDVREVPWTVVDASMVSENNPKFTKSGLAAVNNHNIGGGSYLIKPDGEIVLMDYTDTKEKVISIDKFQPVSEDGYLVADILIEDGAWDRLNGRVILKTTGEVVAIISKDTEFLRNYDAQYPVRKQDLDANGGSFVIKAKE